MRSAKLKFNVFLLLFFVNGIAAQPVSKTMIAFRSIDDIKIDATLDEDGWNKAPKADGFKRFEPDPGFPAHQKSEIKMLYDDKAIYIGALLFDTSPDSILTQFSERDDAGVVDWFGLTIDAYQDGQNGVGFFSTAAGVQLDTKYSDSGGDNDPLDSGDGNWDAVWESKVRITNEGWIVEMKIPYSALRFPKKEIQDWNINFFRMIRRYREQSSWSEIDPSLDGFMIQSGKMIGLENIKSPVRLSATPFIAGYTQQKNDPNANPKKTSFNSFNAGMDLKYGLNDAFTLDMTVIPDFGEAASDQQVLNLSAFEVEFDENRQFFTEGTELFDKGDIFYSRRIGGTPFGFYDLNESISNSDSVLINPVRAQLINASKLSGRTKKGLGIGVFNAIEAKSFAIVLDKSTNRERQVETNPLTNYNVFVLSQNLKNNSSISITNTNVLRSGKAYEANVTGVTGTLNDKANKYELGFSGTLSQKYFTESTDLGHQLGLFAGKTSGNFNYSLGYNEESDSYDPNDLGLLFANNERTFFAEGEYNWFKPFGNFNKARVSFGSYYERLYQPNVFNKFRINVRGFVATKNFLGVGLFGSIQPTHQNNYFEARTPDFSRFIKFPSFGSGGFFISSDYRKIFALDLDVYYGGNRGLQGRYYGTSIYPRIQVNDRLRIRPRWALDIEKNDPVYVKTQGDEIIFGMTDQKTWTTELEMNYVFGPKISLTFNGRHYWSTVSYSSFHNIDNNGGLIPTEYNQFSDRNFNAFNIDAVFRWRYAPGSDIFFVWKNNFNSDETIAINRFSDNWKRIQNLPIRNSFSLKIIYYLDYLNFKKT